jgi:hypothetical protein
MQGKDFAQKVKREEGNRPRMTRIVRISADQISENQLNPRPSAVYSGIFGQSPGAAGSSA